MDSIVLVYSKSEAAVVLWHIQALAHRIFNSTNVIAIFAALFNIPPSLILLHRKFTRRALNFDAATDQKFKDFTISVLKTMVAAATVFEPSKAVAAVLGAMNALALVALSSYFLFRQCSSRL
jgi:hypothetical protein